MKRLHSTRMEPALISAVVADVDGTLLTSGKELTDRARDAVHRLGDRGIRFMITSSRPPRGLEMLVEPLQLSTPLAAFNGGTFVTPNLVPIRRLQIPDPLVAPICGLLRCHGLDVWVYTDADWYVTDCRGSHIDRESTVVGFVPDVERHLDRITGAVKIVGVSDNQLDLEATAVAMGRSFAGEVSASRSQPYYLDITHPAATKGNAVRFLSESVDLDRSRIATIGDMPNDIDMFEAGGLAIAMGNADAAVRSRADVVTGTNDEEGFAEAMDRFVLGTSRTISKGRGLQ